MEHVLNQPGPPSQTGESKRQTARRMNEQSVQSKRWKLMDWWCCRSEVDQETGIRPLFDASAADSRTVPLEEQSMYGEIVVDQRSVNLGIEAPLARANEVDETVTSDFPVRADQELEPAESNIDVGQMRSSPYRITELREPTVKQLDESLFHNEKHRLEKVADTLTRLYRPDPPEEVELDIIFFHGFDLDNESPVHLSTWKTGDGHEELWPQVWLSQEYPKAQITVVSYDASIYTTATQGRVDLYLIRETLFQDIERELGGHYPVILVGHSFGGLVIKEFCLEAHRKKKANGAYAFMERIRGIFFYSTPHQGMNDEIVCQLEVGNRSENDSMVGSRSANNSLLSSVKALNTYAARLQHDFCLIRNEYSWKIYGLMETIAVEGASDVLVPEASSRFGDVCSAVDGCDHFSICRPTGKECNSYQYLVQLIKTVCDTPKKVKRKQSKMETVGIDSLVTDIVAHLQHKMYLGLWGMGGVGKTTLAKRVFEEIGEDFEYTCFVEGFKLISGDREEVEKKVWRKMRHHGRPISNAEGEGDWYQVAGKKLLIVLDDIESQEHIRFLQRITEDNDMESSRFVVTSRNREVLSRLDGYRTTHLHEMSVLGDEDATRLFLNCALGVDEEPVEWMEDIIEEIVRGCGGLPLTLEVLGRYLRSIRSESTWKELPKALRKAEELSFLQEQVWVKLRVSYDALQKEEKNVFLDLACTFFSGDEWFFTHERWAYILSSRCISVSNVLQSLMDKSLIKLKKREEDDEDDEEFTFQMHEHLRSMGEKIAQDQGNLYITEDTPGEEIRNILSDRSLCEKIASFKCDSSDVCNPCPGGHLCVSSMIYRALPQRSSLLYLDVRLTCSRDPSTRGLSLRIPTSVVYARLRVEDTWHYTLNAGLQPLGKLAYLDWYDTDASFTLSATACASLGALKFLDLSCSPELENGSHFPVAFQNFRDCQELFLHMSPSIWDTNIDEEKMVAFSDTVDSKLEDIDTDEDFEDSNTDEDFEDSNTDEDFEDSDTDVQKIVSLPDTVGQLPRLRTLTLFNIGCEELPNTIGDLKELVRLDIVECRNLCELPKNFGSLSKLEYLNMENLESLRQLPESIGNLGSLKKLVMEEVELVDLPETFGNLSKLKHLYLWCKSLQKLPETFGNLSQLQYLELGSMSLERLPKTFGNLSSLQHLEMTISGKVLVDLPETFANLRSLEHLEIRMGEIHWFEDQALQIPDDSAVQERFPLTSLPIGKLSKLKTLIVDHSWPLIRSHVRSQLSVKSDELIRLEKVQLCECVHHL